MRRPQELSPSDRARWHAEVTSFQIRFVRGEVQIPHEIWKNYCKLVPGGRDDLTLEKEYGDGHWEERRELLDGVIDHVGFLHRAHRGRALVAVAFARWELFMAGLCSSEIRMNRYVLEERRQQKRHYRQAKRLVKALEGFLGVAPPSFAVPFAETTRKVLFDENPELALDFRFPGALPVRHDFSTGVTSADTSPLNLILKECKKALKEAKVPGYLIGDLLRATFILSWNQ